MSINSKFRSKRTRRRRKSRDSESCKRRLPIGKLRSMPSELRELSRRVKDKPERGRDSSTKNARESSLTLKLPDKPSSPRNKRVLLNKPESKEKTT